MLNSIYKSLVVTLVLGFILCGFYPLVVYGLGNLFFRNQAEGGILVRNGKAVGARLIGQKFSEKKYFHGRPSAAKGAGGEQGYDASNSSGSNLGPTNQKLFNTLQENIDHFMEENPHVKKGKIPTESVTSSASGLDPHISPEAAYAQMDRVAQARNMNLEVLRSMVKEYIEGPQFGVLGEPVVNVLVLNLALDEKGSSAKSDF